MAVVPSRRSCRWLAIAVALCTPLPGIAADRASRTEQEWVRRQRASAEAMISKLDMTSFANSIGPGRTVGKRTLAQYGFTELSTFDDGWAYAKMADGSWEFGIFVLTDGDRTKLLCVTDTALGGGSYRATTGINAKLQPDGFWRSTRLLGPVVGC